MPPTDGYRTEQTALARMTIRLRYVSALAQLLTVAFVQYRLQLELPLAALLSAISVVALFNVASHAWLRRGYRIDARWLLLQLGFDTVALTVLLYFSGGPTNPFVSLYLVPIALAAGALEFRATLGLALLSVALYSGLMKYHVALPHLHGNDFDLHVTGMWVNFLLGTSVLVAVLGRFTQQLREQRGRIGELRERILRDESLLALGAMAAGTAHELNTPLTTLGLLVDEAQSSQSVDNLPAMRSEIARCRDHVTTLVRIARGEHRLSMQAQPVAELVRDAIDRMRLLRPELELGFDDHAGQAWIEADETFSQALLNLLDNAARASSAEGRRTIDVVIRQTASDAITVEIADRGPGMHADAGDAIQSGLGIGLLLTNATIERLGGEVRQSNRPGGGCITSLRLPVAVGSP